MDEPRSLDSLFKEKLFRIPDYQRGYAWQIEQIKAFWEDLINLSPARSHYTGVLTLKQISPGDLAESDKEYWLVEDHSYRLFHIVDGQQRLTTFVVFLQAFVELVSSLPENNGLPDEDVYISDSLVPVAQPEIGCGRLPRLLESQGFSVLGADRGRLFVILSVVRTTRTNEKGGPAMRPKCNNQPQFRFQPLPTLKITERYYGQYERIDAIRSGQAALIDLIHRDIAEPLDCEKAPDATGEEC